MSDHHKARNRTYRMKADAITFVDAFAETYGVSKSAVIHLSLNTIRTMIESQTAPRSPKRCRIGNGSGNASANLQPVGVPNGYPQPVCV